MTDRQQHLRLIEAVLFASAQPVDQAHLAQRLPEGADIPALLAELKQFYTERGVNLCPIAGKWAFRTAPDLAPFLRVEAVVQRRLSRASIETLAIIAYHQPVSRAEVEEIRGVALSKGTLDILLEAGWIKPAGRRETPGRPLTWRTTPAFLEHFGLNSLDDLPGLDDLKAAGLLERRPGFATIAMRSEEAEAVRNDAAREGAADAVEAASAEERDPTPGKPSAARSKERVRRTGAGETESDAGEEVGASHEGPAAKPPQARSD